MFLRLLRNFFYLGIEPVSESSLETIYLMNVKDILNYKKTTKSQRYELKTQKTLSFENDRNYSKENSVVVGVLPGVFPLPTE